jgi:thiamine-monophosphate kinase
MHSVKINELGEQGLLKIIKEMVARSDRSTLLGEGDLILGIGDDAASWKTNEAVTLATTDTMVDGVHFSTEHLSWKDIGWKAIAVNISDIAAMGGTSLYALVTLGLNPDKEVDDVIALYEGMLSACREYTVRIVGGDLVRSSVDFVTIALTGEHSNGGLTRGSMQTGDLIAVTGHLGSSAAGLALMTNGIKGWHADRELLIQSHIHPIPRIMEARILVENNIKAAMDISDGLLIDLKRFCESSSVGADIYSDSIPIALEVHKVFPNDALAFALSGGEDYELLFSGSEELITRILPVFPSGASIIGKVVDQHMGDVVVFNVVGDILKTERLGWDHFKI